MKSGFSIDAILASKSLKSTEADRKQKTQRINPYDGHLFYSASRFYGYHGCTCSSQSSLPNQPMAFLVTRRIHASHHGNQHFSNNHHHSSNNNSEEEDKMARRPRTSITLCQRERLEEEFQKERYPTLAYIDKLSRRVHLPQYVIKVWFQNRRAKYRKEGHKHKQQQKQQQKQQEQHHNLNHGLDRNAEDTSTSFMSDDNPVHNNIDLSRSYCNTVPWYQKHVPHPEAPFVSSSSPNEPIVVDDHCHCSSNGVCHEGCSK